MINWKNSDELKSFNDLFALKDQVKLAEVMEGANGAERVKKYWWFSTRITTIYSTF